MAEGAVAGVKQSNAELDRLIRAIEAMQGTLKTRIGSLNGAVDMMQTAWSSEAGKRANDFQREIIVRAQRLEKNLRYMQELMEKAKDGFTQQELNEIAEYEKAQRNSPISAFVDSTPNVKGQ
ncbi:hypothetical protein E0L36_13540 [Streptomyces sp. AJS327]|uniref:WXG100 family type VII secretion target n=1 Tax=Streptomyces sp. AJS327 TaxID=2545265 RepID=UPI0015DEB12A|nr:WXG100 family type VII secretion target [Streptomyces sp. AJS327]MBA0051883.1 hypothetical protein [Streptomyces sp. AJS327]